jgi:hypothetical protein
MKQHRRGIGASAPAAVRWAGDTRIVTTVVDMLQLM